jgi:hypothetical protein
MGEHDAALRLDAAVDDVLSGMPPNIDAATASALERLAAAHRVDPPPALAGRIRAAERARWRPARLAAAALAMLFLGQGLSSLVSGRWVARNLDVPFDAHASFELGLLLFALGGVVLAGALARRWLDLAAAAGVPLGIAFAVSGLSELGEFPGGGVLHLSQGVAAIALAAFWWRARRYVLPFRPKRGHES